MKVGIFPMLDPNAGGIYQYSITMLDALSVLKQKEKKYEYYIFAPFIFHQKLQKYIDNGFIIQPLEPLSFNNLFKNIFKSIIGVNLSSHLYGLISNKDNHQKIKKDTINYNYSQKKWFDRFSIDLMIYSAPYTWSFETGIPYIMAIHDLQHRLHPEFPEVSAGGEWEEREYLYRNACKYATLILAESETGKEDILKCYSDSAISENRIKILPYVPSFKDTDKLINIRQKIKKTFRLPDRYLFYPAAFWPHKNHLRIIEALALIKRKKGANIPILFTGSNVGVLRKNTYDEVRGLSQKLSLDSHFLGYVEDNVLIALYQNAVAMIMPTFFGPSNIPILEAWQMNCPVLTSDIRGVREQAGNAALLVNPASVEDIAQGIYTLWTDKKIREDLIKKGKQKLSEYTFSDYCNRLNKILDEAKRFLDTPSHKTYHM